MRRFEGSGRRGGPSRPMSGDAYNRRHETRRFTHCLTAPSEFGGIRTAALYRLTPERRVRRAASAHHGEDRRRGGHHPGNGGNREFIEVPAEQSVLLPHGRGSASRHPADRRTNEAVGSFHTLAERSARTQRGTDSHTGARSRATHGY